MIVSIKPGLPFGASDYITIACRLRLFPKKNQYVRHVYMNYNQFRRELSREDWSFIKNADTPESWDKVKDILVSSYDKHTTIKPRTFPFLTCDIKLKIRKKKKKQWKPTQVNYDRFKQLCNKARLLSQKLTRDYEEAIADASKPNL